MLVILIVLMFTIILLLLILILIGHPHPLVADARPGAAASRGELWPGRNKLTNYQTNNKSTRTTPQLKLAKQEINSNSGQVVSGEMSVNDNDTDNDGNAHIITTTNDNNTYNNNSNNDNDNDSIDYISSNDNNNDDNKHKGRVWRAVLRRQRLQLLRVPALHGGRQQIYVYK